MKRVIFTLCFLLAFLIAKAVPAKRGIWQTVTLEDGSKIEVELRGSEFMRFYQSEDSTVYTQDPLTGLFKRASLDSLRLKAEKKRSLNPSKRNLAKLSTKEKAAIYTGEKRGLIILVEFSDVKFQASNTRDLYDRIANEEGFTSEDGFRGSVRDYFKDQSYGQFLLDFDVVGPATLSKSYAYYGENDSSGDEYSSRLNEFVREACIGVMNEVDFSSYDWDGDGYVDQVFLLYAGKGEADGGGAYTIWPHEWDLYSTGYGMISLNGVLVNTYACSNEITPRGRIEGIGTICHEFSHCFGLPDTYDTGYKYFGMSYWDIMDSGEYNSDGFVPAGFTGYERIFCGWVNPMVLNSSSSIEGMQAITDSPDIY
ncbi:MAG: M6 family metalloprotease domain-containing protein, partial [Prevotella sp.]|nr:M6 family metalloprotease domain-containing protein [Prevotella sp.]